MDSLAPWERQIWRILTRNKKCGAKIRRGKPCRMRPVTPFNDRCWLHGELSTCPRTAEGCERIADAQRRRWDRWRAERGLTFSARRNSEFSTTSPVYGPQIPEPLDEVIHRPDPDGVYVEETGHQSWRVIAEIWEQENRRNRLRRMQAIAANLRRNGWRCDWCGEEIPI